MKKILILMIGLLFAMPMFGQKLNSRGEKMVKTLKCHSRYSQPTSVLTFSYDENDEIVSIRLNQYKNYEIILGIKNGQVYAQGFKNGEKVNERIASITMNDDGNVEGFLTGSSDGDSYSFQEHKFYYTTDPSIGKPVITKEKEVTRCSASYFGDNDGASYNYVPTAENEAKKAYKTEFTHSFYSLYLIENGYTTCVSSDEQWNKEGTHKQPIVSKQLNDLNINLYALLEIGLEGPGIESIGLLYCSPWLPFACKYFPSKNSHGYQYVYTIKKGNIITIRKISSFGSDKNMLVDDGDYIEIEYVEQ